MNLLKIPNKKGDKIYYYFDYGRSKGQRPTTGIFTYTNPKDQVERNHNKEALLILKTKESQLIIDAQATGGAYIPRHRFKENFLDYYEEYVTINQQEGNRHLSNSFTQFKEFIKKEFISSVEITENFCIRFRQFLLDKFTGETPLNYYARFKRVMKAATKDKYFHENPTEDVNARSNSSKSLKENLEVDEYLKLLRTPCENEEVGLAFIFCLYSALRWVDVKRLKWPTIKENALTTRIIQRKTGKPVVITLHPIALEILEQQRNKRILTGDTSELVFQLPSADGANTVIGKWVSKAGIEKYITWSCARLSFSILLQDERIDEATVAYFMGHTTTAQVRKIYKRHRPKAETAAIGVLPTPSQESRKKMGSEDAAKHPNISYVYSIK
ncbi:MAG: site-specific integrase [Sporocytophaga sp.]|uniref:site-specific integrase n=1 Tax=Sporocytophaga sp. TaxID=2231183 RepID=UPI001B26908A|nr:site-specific integrase [Sporocytophaga sp.]MBO9703712.1 site-specific integrase [Sporocytophaga sp.]